MLRRFGFTLAAAFLAAAPAAAQDVKPVQLTIGGGYTAVLGPIKDHVANGGNFTIGVLFNTKSPLSLIGMEHRPPVSVQAIGSSRSTSSSPRLRAPSRSAQRLLRWADPSGPERAR